MNRKKKILSAMAAGLALVLLAVQLMSAVPYRAEAASSGELKAQLEALEEEKKKNEIEKLNVFFEKYFGVI